MSDSSKKIVLKKLTAHNTIWHPESTLVFKSQKDRLVIGRYVDDEVIPLDDIAINLCETWKFKPDESLFEGEDENSAEESNDELHTEKAPDQVEKVLAEENLSTQVEKIIPKHSNEIENIQNITEGFTVQLYAAVNILINQKNSLLSELQKKYDDKEEALSDLQKKYDDKEETLSDLQKKYDDIKKKFDTMKSLFN